MQGAHGQGLARHKGVGGERADVLCLATQVHGCTRECYNIEYIFVFP